MDLTAWAPHGRSLLDYFAGDRAATLIVRSDLGEYEEIPAAAWFRGPPDFGPLERTALELCRGRVLDVGAGTGCHSLVLQERGLEVCAIDVVPEAVEIMRKRGVREVHQADVVEFRSPPFDTVLMLSNGAGLAETLPGLDRFLRGLRRLVTPEGQILLDSTDLTAEAAPDWPGLKDSRRDGRFREDGRYIGEIQFQLEYRGEKGPPFPQLWVDPETLRQRAVRAGWVFELVQTGEAGSYLARLTLAARPRLGGCPE